MRFLVNNRNPKGGITYHRLQKPFEFLKRASPKIEYDFFWDPAEIDGDYDYLVFNRSLGWKYTNDEYDFIKHCKKQGLKVIMDIDDYWELPDYHTIVWRPDINYKEWQNGLIMNLSLADYIWTSTDYLATKLREKTHAPVVVAPNALDWDEEQWTRKGPKKYPNKVNIGWCGSATHHKDLDQLRRPLAAINKRYHKDIQIHLSGLSISVDWVKQVSERFINNATNAGKYKNVHAWSGVPVDMYGHLYDQYDIALGVVIDNEFNRCKSELKVLEAGAKYIPFIGSDCITYNRTGANIDLCSTPQEWVDSLKDLITEKNLREELGKELGEYVRDEYRIDKSNAARLSIL